MKYVEFKREYAIAGKKEGDLAAFKNKIPPHLVGYTKELTKEQYESAQKKAAKKAEDDEEDLAGLPSEKEQRKVAEQSSSGDAHAAANVSDVERKTVPAYDLERSHEENARLNPPEVSQPGNRLPNDIKGAGLEKPAPVTGSGRTSSTKKDGKK